MKLGLLVATLAFFAGACPTPKPSPAPVTPTPDADASTPTPPAPTVSCASACQHAEQVCKGAGASCAGLCPRVSLVDQGYAPCVMAATGCYNCDARARGAKSKH